MRTRMIGLGCAILACACAATAAQIHVAPDGSGDVPTIQAAIDAAAAADTIMLADGVFTGPGNRDLVLAARNCQIQSASGVATACVINLQSHGGFLQSNDAWLTLLNLTVTGGYRDDGGAVDMEDGRLFVRDCRFFADHATDRGGAIYTGYYAGPMLIEDSEFWQNDAYEGAAAYFRNSGATLRRCTFHHHAGSAISIIDGLVNMAESCMFTQNSNNNVIVSLIGGTASFDHCTFASNDTHYGAVYLFGASAYVTSCTFVDNSGSYVGDISQGGQDEYENLTIRNSLFAYYRAPHALVRDPFAVMTIECTDIYTAGQGWYGDLNDLVGTNGNVDADPLICDLDGGDLHVADTSICLPANNDCDALIGAYDEGCDGDGWVVYPDGHGLLSTIQMAIDAAPAGTEILLADGVFTGEGNVDLDVRGRDVTLRSASGDPAGCVIDAGGTGRVFDIHSTVYVLVQIKDITIRGGWSDGAGGGVLVASGAPWFENCRFEQNQAVWGGALAAMGGAWPVLRRCVFYDNVALLGAAISEQQAHVDIYSCTVAANQAPGAAVFGQAGGVRLEQTIVADTDGGPAVVLADAAVAYLNACDLFGNDGGDWTNPIADQLVLRNNFTAPPCFCDVESGVLTLCADSWCLPEYNPEHNDLLIGALGAGCEACGCAGATGSETLPAAGVMIAAAPNPFNPATTIAYRLDRAGPATLAVFDLQGRRVATLFEGPQAAGAGEVVWQGRDDRGRAVESGIYVCRLVSAPQTATIRLALVK